MIMRWPDELIATPAPLEHLSNGHVRTSPSRPRDLYHYSLTGYLVDSDDLGVLLGLKRIEVCRRSTTREANTTLKAIRPIHYS